MLKAIFIPTWLWHFEEEFYITVIDVHDCINCFHFFIKISCFFLIIIIISLITLPRLSVVLGWVRRRKFTPNPKVKGHFLGVCLLDDMFLVVLLCLLYDMFVVVQLFASLLVKLFLVNLYAPDI
jgi:hypothetical protein